MMGSEGTIAFGVNSVEAQFSQFKQSVLSPPEKPKKVELPKKVETIMAAPDAPEPEGGEIEVETEEVEIPHEKKEEIEDYTCIKINSQESRVEFCEKEFSGKNANSTACAGKFCDMCCFSKSKNLGECKLKCEEATVKQTIKTVDLEKCSKPIPNQTDEFNLEACKNCCNT